MADTNTANIGLLVADPNDLIQYTAHIGNNLGTIDALMGAVDCLSTSRPSNTYKGQIAYEHDSKMYVQNTGTKASPTWTYMTHTAMAVTAATLPTSGLHNGMMAYATDTNNLYVCDGSIFRIKTNTSVTSSTRPSSAVVEAGATIYETDTTRSYVYDGSNWKPVAAAILNAPKTTSANGTATTSATETMDSVLGTYQFQAVAGRRYEYRLNGMIGNGSAVGDTFTLKIRDSQTSSTPTTSDQAVAESTWACFTTGTGGRYSVQISGTFVSPNTGTHTIAFFAVRISGSGVFTPLSPPDIPRELYVYDTGSN